MAKSYEYNLFLYPTKSLNQQLGTVFSHALEVLYDKLSGPQHGNCAISKIIDGHLVRGIVPFTTTNPIIEFLLLLSKPFSCKLKCL
jgi:hypothetical protein